MKIMLINPPRYKGSGVIREVRCAGLSLGSIYPPIRLAYTAALLNKHGYEVDILDCNGYDYGFEKIEEKVKYFQPSLVVFTSSPTTMSHDLRTATICKKVSSGIAVALDDSHIAPVMPERILNNFKDVDILIKGESESTTLALVENIESLEKVCGISHRLDGIIKHNPEAGPQDINKIPFPFYKLLPINQYSATSRTRKRPFVTIITSVGCPFKCSFCITGGATVWRGYDKKWRSKNSERVVDEIEFLQKEYGVKSIYVFDETFTIDKERVIKICEGLIKRNIKIEWSCNSRVDTIDKEMLKLMKRAGCWIICYGVESAENAILEGVMKANSKARALETFKLSREIGIGASASFMLGLPGETKQTVQETLKFAKELDPNRAQFVITTPYPGTKLYEEAVKNNLLEREYTFTGFDAYGLDCEPSIRTEAMTAMEILKEQKRIFRRFYFTPSFMAKTLLRISTFAEFKALFRSIKYLR